MKIVHLCLCGPVTDGLQYQENLLSKYHRCLGHDVTVIASQWVWSDRGTLQRDTRSCYVNADGVKMVRLPLRRGTVASKLKRYPGLRDTLEREAPDVLFIHGCQFPDADVTAAFLRANPAVTAYVDNHADASNSGTNWLSRNILHRVLWRRCAQLLEPYVKTFYGVLPARVTFLKTLYGLPAEKCELLVMGGDDELIERARASGAGDAVRAGFGVREDALLLVTGGKIDQWKTETLRLMEAVIALDRPDVQLLVFGSVAPELRGEFDCLCADERIEYVGWLSAEESYGCMDAADLVVFPGRHSVLWEQAVALGKPCVFRDAEGFHHVDLGGNAVFAKDLSTEGLRTLLGGLLAEPERLAAMRRVAEEKGPAVFSYREIARKCIE